MSEKIIEVTIDKIPDNIYDFIHAAEKMMGEPVNSAALFIYTLYLYSRNEKTGYPLIEYMLNGLKPGHNISNIARNKKITLSYFKGANKENEYTPSLPYTIIVKTDDAKGIRRNLKTVYIGCSGTNSYRPLTLIKVKYRSLKRKGLKKDLWFVYEYPSLTLDIKE